MSAAWVGWLVVGLISVIVCLLGNAGSRDDSAEQEATAPEPGTGHHIHDEETQ